MAQKQINRAECGELANRVLKYYKTVAGFDSKKTWQHFKQEVRCKATIHRYISKYKDLEKVDFKKNPGRLPTVVTPQTLKTIKKTLYLQPIHSHPCRCSEVKNLE